MSSYISVGFVVIDYEEAFIEKCISLFTNKDICNIVYKYPLDEHGDLWKEQQITNGMKGIFAECFRREDSYILADYVSDTKVIRNMFIRIRNLGKKEFGIVFEMPEDELILLDELEDVENKIINEMEKVLKKGVEYAFCDNEAELEYTKERLLRCKKRYSILGINCDGKVTITRANWRIDGITAIL